MFKAGSSIRAISIPTKNIRSSSDVHGGPALAVLSEWPSCLRFLHSPLAGAGYFVLQPNPRGSFGQGEAFTRANVKDFGYGDFRDIMAGVDEAIKVAPIDPNRLGITGWSYGGYMTMWAVTQTNRFKAAMAGAGLSNWQSYYGENLHRSVDDSVLRQVRLRRSGCLRQKFAHQFHQERQNAHAHPRRRQRRRMSPPRNPTNSGTPSKRSASKPNSSSTNTKATCSPAPNTAAT